MFDSPSTSVSDVPSGTSRELRSSIDTIAAEIADSTFRRQLRSHGLWTALGRVASLLASAAVGLVLARLLSKDDFGRVIVLQTIISLAALMAAFGLGTASLRLVGRDNAETNGAHRRRILADVSCVGLISHLTIGLLVLLFFRLFGHDILNVPVSWPVSLALAMSIIARGVAAILADLHRALDRIISANMLAGVNGGPLLNAMFLGACMLTPNLDWERATYAYLAACLASNFLCLGGLWRLARATPPLPSTSATPPGRQLSTICQLCLPLAGIAVLSFAVSQADVLIASTASHDAGQIAYYAAARRATVLITIPLTVSTMIVSGLISPLLAKGNQRRLESLLQALTTLSALPCLLMTAIYAVAPHWTMELLFGPGYGASALYVLALLPGNVALVVTGSCGMLLMLAHRERFAFSMSLLAAVQIFVIGPIVVVYGGLLAYAWFVSGVVILHNVANAWACYSLLGIKTWPAVRPTWTFLQDQLVDMFDSATRKSHFSSESTETQAMKP